MPPRHAAKTEPGCNCFVERTVLERRENRGTAPAPAQKGWEPRQKTFVEHFLSINDEWEVGFLTAMVFVGFGVAVAEGIKLGKRQMQATANPGPATI